MEVIFLFLLFTLPTNASHIMNENLNKRKILFTLFSFKCCLEVFWCFFMAFGDSELGDREFSLFTFHDRRRFCFASSLQFIRCDWLWCHDSHPFITAAVYFSNHSHKRMSLFGGERRKSIEWHKNKTEKKSVAACAVENKQETRRKNEKFSVVLCVCLLAVFVGFHSI